MEAMLNDERFSHVIKDPKFRRIPKCKWKVKIDKRFQSMFEDKKFHVKYTVDKRGRPVSQTSFENLRKYYHLSSSEEESSDEESNSIKSNEQSNKQETKENVNKFKANKDANNTGKDVELQETNSRSSQEEEDNGNENFPSNEESLLESQPEYDFVTYKTEKNLDKGINVKSDSKKQLKIKRVKGNKLDIAVKQKLHDLTIDYARGEGVLLSDSSSEEESSDYEDSDLEHMWGELDKEAETTEEITHRLAVCNMDWDRIRAADLIVLFNSFLPTGGLIQSVTIYPSEFGLKRLKEEETKGPIELVESKNKVDGEDKCTNSDDENEEGSSYHMEKLRQYQLNRLKYYYAVIVFDSANTANKVYNECDGLEYESSSTKIDLRFIPDDMTFNEEPKEFCDKLPDLTKYKPRQFTTTALQQVKVDLTWDETNPERLEISHKLNSGKLDDVDKNDIQAYLASGSSEDESNNEVEKQFESIDASNVDENPINKYKELLRSIEQAEEEKKNKEVELEFTWGVGSKEKTEKLVKKKIKSKEELTAFEQYLEKRKLKKKAKRDQNKILSKDADQNGFESENSMSSDIETNDSYFAEEPENTNKNMKKRKSTLKTSDLDSTDEEEANRKKAEIELLLLDETQENVKQHFSMKRIELAESLTKSKKKRSSKKKKMMQEEASKDEFVVNMQDSRFGALFTSHYYNIDPADPHYRKTKGTEAIIQEKIRRRNENDKNILARKKR